MFHKEILKLLSRAGIKIAQALQDSPAFPVFMRL